VKRAISLLTVAAIMVAMLLASALPAFAVSQGNPPCQAMAGLETAHSVVPETAMTAHENIPHPHCP
jgi:hypothetical protein